MSTLSLPPILSLLISHIAAAVPRRARITFTELLIGAAATRGGHVGRVANSGVGRRMGWIGPDFTLCYPAGDRSRARAAGSARAPSTRRQSRSPCAATTSLQSL